MRGCGSICAVLAALLCAIAAGAAEPAPKQASAVRAVTSGLRQSLSDNGLGRALTQARDWVRELEVSWTAHLNGRTAAAINVETETERGEAAVPAAAAAKHVTFASRPARLDLGLLSLGGSSDNDDRVWAIGHVQPLASLVTGTRNEHKGSVTSERSLTSHDLELGLRVPMMPWDATIAGDRYWWGVRGFGPQVAGMRFALKLHPLPNVEIAGGRAADTRGSGGFVGLSYRAPLDPSQ
jgi:hypothetical protein